MTTQVNRDIEPRINAMESKYYDLNIQGLFEDESSYLIWFQGGRRSPSFLDTVYKIVHAMGLSSM